MILRLVIDIKHVNNVTIGFEPLTFVNAGRPWFNEALVLGVINGIRSCKTQIDQKRLERERTYCEVSGRERELSDSKDASVSFPALHLSSLQKIPTTFCPL